MLTLASSIRVYVCTQSVDMRKSFDGLSIAARHVVGGDPLGGHLFVFFNRRADLCKVLWWSSGGFCLFAKRLSRGRFRQPTPIAGANHVELGSTELGLILEGIDLRDIKKRTRWEPRNDTRGTLALAS